MASIGIVPNAPAPTSTGRTAHPVTANSPHINPGLMQKLQSLINANPEYLTNGIPTQMLSQIVEQMNVSLRMFSARLCGCECFVCVTVCIIVVY